MSMRSPAHPGPADVGEAHDAGVVRACEKFTPTLTSLQAALADPSLDPQLRALMEQQKRK